MNHRKSSRQNVGNLPRRSEDNRGFNLGGSAHRSRRLHQQSQEPGNPESSNISNQGRVEEGPQTGSRSANSGHSGLSQVYGATDLGHTPIYNRNFTSRDNKQGRGRGTGRDSWVQPGRGRVRARDGFVQQGRGSGRAREAWADNPERTPAEYSHSESIRDDEDEHHFTGRARGSNKRGGRLFPTQYCGHLATDDPRQGRSDQLDQISEGRHQQINETGVQGPHEYQDHIRGDRHRDNQQKTEATEIPGNHVCLYCGDILSEKVVFTQNREAYHEKCFSDYLPWCQEAISAFNGISRKKHVLYMALPVYAVYGSKEQDKKKKKEFRDVKIKELLQKATALRNSDSGFLLIHLIGLDPEDNFTGAFDEFADVKLQGLINDGSLFDNVYKKRRLGDFDKPELKKCTNILVLYVEKGEFLATSDFKSKLALDDCIVDIPDQTLLKFIKDARVSEEKFHEIRAQTAEDLCRLQESRHIQTKAVFQTATSDDTVVVNLFDNLRVTEYISAFAKNEDGGSYLLGLAEETLDYSGYRSKRLGVTPVAIVDRERTKKLILDHVSTTCLVSDYLGNEQQSEDLVKIMFVPSTDKPGYALHISVRSVNGVVFFDKTGPVAYRVDERQPETNSIIRVTLTDWFSAYRKRLQ